MVVDWFDGLEFEKLAWAYKVIVPLTAGLSPAALSAVTSTRSGMPVGRPLKFASGM